MEYNPAALPLISLSLHSTKPTDVPIVGVLRDDGEYGMGRDKWITAISPAATVSGTRGKERLNTIVNELLSRNKSNTSLSARWRRSVEISMAYKREKYTALKAKKEVQLEDAHAKVMAFVAMAKEGATDAERMAGDATPNWDIAEKVNSTWQTLVTQIAATDQIIHKALERQTRINASSDFGLLRNKFAEAIAELVSDYGKLDALPTRLQILLGPSGCDGHAGKYHRHTHRKQRGKWADRHEQRLLKHVCDRLRRHVQHTGDTLHATVRSLGRKGTDRDSDHRHEQWMDRQWSVDGA